MAKLLIKGYTLSDKNLTFDHIMSLSYDADRFVPCDSLNFTAALQHGGEEFTQISAYLNGQLLFEGIVDTQEVIKSDNGNLIRFSCRNMTAMLLDNEARPMVYSCFTTKQLFDSYARPYGVARHEFPYTTNNWMFQIKKGESFWTVIERYCKRNYGVVPYINHERVLTILPYNNITHIVSNNRAGSLAFQKLSVAYQRYKLVSRIFMRTATDKLGFYYGVTMDNAFAIGKRIKAVRYYHPAMDDNVQQGQQETTRLITRSNRDFFKVTLVLPYLTNIHIGDGVAVYDSELNHSGLYVTALSVRGSDKGVTTTLTLCDKRFA